VETLTRLDVAQGVHREECTAYRIVARRGGKVRHLGEASEGNKQQAVKTWQAAMRGWSVAAEEEHFARWVSGGDETPADPGR
jgi:hypothetical protein